MGLEPVPCPAPIIRVSGVPENTSDGLVEITHPRIVYLAAYMSANLPGASPSLRLRSGAADRLVAASAQLPDRFGLGVYDAYRSSVAVRALYDRAHAENPGLPDGFVANPDDPNSTPPHSTGGAVDLTLTFDGLPVDLGTKFDCFDERAALCAQEHTDTGFRHLRRMLHQTMLGAGFVTYPPEWWHYSYGDQRWAATVGETSPLYGPT